MAAAWNGGWEHALGFRALGWHGLLRGWVEGALGCGCRARWAGGGGGDAAGPSEREGDGWVGFLFISLFLLFEFMNALQNINIIQNKMDTSA
jgi:hypothetical protein